MGFSFKWQSSLMTAGKAHELWPQQTSENRQMGWYTQKNTHLSMKSPSKLNFAWQLYECLYSMVQQSEPEEVKNDLYKKPSSGKNSFCWKSHILQSEQFSITYYLVTSEKFFNLAKSPFSWLRNVDKSFLPHPSLYLSGCEFWVKITAVWKLLERTKKMLRYNECGHLLTLENRQRALAPGTMLSRYPSPREQGHPSFNTATMTCSESDSNQKTENSEYIGSKGNGVTQSWVKISSLLLTICEIYFFGVQFYKFWHIHNSWSHQYD